MKKRLYKSRKNRIIGGVCAGVADFFNIDPTIIRVITVILACIKGGGLLIYLLLWIIMPYNEKEDLIDDEDVENLKSANINEEEEGSSSKSKKKKNESAEGMHSDQEFDDFFKK
ncbi:MAG: PspC domain-containing protein [Treponema sp.]|nr:PspC domain-containing protein [Treponema sp.]